MSHMYIFLNKRNNLFPVYSAKSPLKLQSLQLKQEFLGIKPVKKGKERMRKPTVRLHRALIKSENNISIPPRHPGITERLSRSQLIFAAILLFHPYGWNMQLYVFTHLLKYKLLMISVKP